MRIVHISDTHLGYQAYRAIDKKLSINQREADVGRAFSQAVDKILKIKPDCVLHTGDLFDSVRPSNRALHFAIGELLRLSQANIPVVIISGNHSLPRMRDTGSVFQLFTLPAFPHLYPVFKSRYEVVNIGGLAIHAIPQCLTKEDFDKQLEMIKLNKKAKYNALMLHAAIAGIPEFSMGEFNEQEVPDSYLKEDFDYIALGHYHKHTQVAENAFYVGSTERFSFNEVGQEKGFLEINLKKAKTTFHPLKIRPMIDLPTINAQGKEAEWVMKELEKIIAKNPISDKIVRLTVDNIAQGAQSALNFPRLRELTAKALHFEPRFNREEKIETVAPAAPSIGRLEREFQEYLSQIAIEEGKACPESLDIARDKLRRRDELLKLGLEYLKKAGGEA